MEAEVLFFFFLPEDFLLRSRKELFAKSGWSCLALGEAAS
jgi:hypothetical protein